MNKFFLFLLLPFALHASPTVFDQQVLPLTIKVGNVHQLKVHSIPSSDLPPITTQDIDRGLYVLKKAVTVNISTQNEWKLFMELLDTPLYSLLWRISDSNDNFSPLPAKTPILLKGSLSPTTDSYLALDLAIKLSWKDKVRPPSYVSLEFSLQEGSAHDATKEKP